MSELDDLYQEIILDHNRRPRNFGPLPNPTHKADGHNPLCGDEVTVFIQLDGDRIADIKFDGQGCAISKASASLMTTHLKGKTLDEVRAIEEKVKALLTGPDDAPPALDELGDMAALAGVRKFAVRVKCATLPWHTLDAALKGGGSVSTETE